MCVSAAHVLLFPCFWSYISIRRVNTAVPFDIFSTQCDVICHHNAGEALYSGWLEIMAASCMSFIHGPTDLPVTA